ncbi:MAG: aromatic ring-hydroxylating dioxygenase subunit alpha [Candidatus Binatia bacterium]
MHEVGEPRASTAASAKLHEEDFAATQRPPLEASILPLYCYTSPEFYQREIDRIFSKEWLCLGRVDQVENPGDYFTIDIIGEPLVVVRDQDGAIRVLSRVCRHRGMSVVEGQGNRRSFECPYHAWTYALDGRLIGAPEMEKSKNFDRRACRLPSIKVELWEGFIFANFDPEAKPLGPQLAGLSANLKNYQIGSMKSAPPVTYRGKCNWKIMIENFQEYYHVLGLHREVLEDLMPARFSRAEELDGAYAYIHLHTMAPDVGLIEGTDEIPRFPVIETLTEQERSTHPLALVFPTLGVWITTDAMIFYQMLPEAVDQTVMRVFMCVPPKTMEMPNFAASLKHTIASFESVNDRDLWCCEAVQQGFSSRFAERGRLSHMERCIWQIHQWVLRRVLDETGSADAVRQAAAAR